MNTLNSTVEVDDLTLELVKPFDYTFDGNSSFTPPNFEYPQESFGIGLIIGSSGSGKSTILNTINNSVETPTWDSNRSVASHFDSVEDARERLTGVGLNSVPTWTKPYNVLSTGERFRADMARMLDDEVVIDEFTSVVDRQVAQSICYAISRYIKQRGFKRVVFASCHYDIVPWLEPDWVFDTGIGEFLPRGSLQQREEIKLEVIPCGVEGWTMFRDHHYLTGDINKSAHCWLATWNDTPVGFSSAIAMPNRYIKNAWRGHRTVVLPDFQGMGFGVRISDAIAELFLAQGRRYFSKTSHPRMGEYRERSPYWKPTSKNKVVRKDYLIPRESKEKNYRESHAFRLCYSHEYIGKNSS